MELSPGQIPLPLELEGSLLECAADALEALREALNSSPLDEWVYGRTVEELELFMVRADSLLAAFLAP